MCQSSDYMQFKSKKERNYDDRFVDPIQIIYESVLPPWHNRDNGMFSASKHGAHPL